MFGALGVAGFVAAFGIGVWQWRENRAQRIRAVLVAGYAFLAAFAAVAVSGVPLLLYRTRRSTLTPSGLSALHIIHHHAGRVFIILFVLYWPLLMVVSVARPKTPWRKFLSGFACVICAYLFLFVSFTGYLLPPGLPRSLTLLEARHALRFFVLHAFACPPLAMLALSFMLWRNGRESAPTQ